MDKITNLIFMAFLLALTGAFVFLCMVFIRYILYGLLSPKLSCIYKAIKPLFVPTSDYDPTYLEKSYWRTISVLVLVFLTLAIVIFFRDLFELLWIMLIAAI